MNVTYMLLIGLLMFSADLLAKKELPVNRYSCQNVEYKIESIKEKQRKGYKSKQGEKLRADMKLLKQLKTDCKLAKFATK